jgi:hypothetical protein
MTASEVCAEVSIQDRADGRPGILVVRVRAQQKPASLRFYRIQAGPV